MTKKLLTVLSVLLLSAHLHAQPKLSENIVVITMDGLRWQEVFGGADSLLSFDTAAAYSTGYIGEKFWAPGADARREKLMPFFWSTLRKQGVLLGNRNYGNNFNNANPYWFSYPGYNEIFTGYPDTAVNSNDKIPNKNETVFEFLNKLPEYKGKTVVFGSWDVYASIFNEGRSGLLVNDGFRDLGGKLNEKQVWLNRLQYEMPAIFHGGERLDVATFQIGFEYMKVNKPKLIYFGLGDCDEFAHAGVYDAYLDAAQNFDDWIRQLWEYIQSTPAYRDKTTILITTDHGRGLAEGGNWKHHGQRIPEASEMWMAAIGPSVKPVGEAKTKQQAYQGQIAATIAALLGKQFTPAHKPLPVLKLD
ncbi:MAG: phosphoglyceromutase [Chitinophagaceae bacterium]|nr:MAG: phosphoglyceromutase [Chitinophagaceae bacterium]